MSSSLAATFVSQPGSAELEAYWIRLEQPEPEADEMSVAEAAKLIDAAFSLDPCGGDGSMTGGGEAAVEAESDSDEKTAAAPIDLDSFNFLVRKHMSFAGCQYDTDGGYVALVRVYRSHQDEGCELNVTGGEVLAGATVQVSEQVSEELEVDGASVTCEFPVAGGVAVSMGEVRSVKGSTVNFTEKITGKVTIDHATQYDLVSVAVSPDPDNPGRPMDCTVFAFFHGTADDKTVSAPPVDEAMTESEKADYCPDISVEFDPDRGEMTCYEYHTMTDNCRCSGERESLETLEVKVDCPDHLQCPDSSDCRQFLAGRWMVARYVSCPGEEGKDDCGNPDYVKQMCCGYLPPNIPPCCEVRSVYRGGAEIEKGPDYYKAIYGDAVQMVALLPKDGICGDQVDTYETPDDCCDGVADLVYSSDSVDILADHHQGVISWEGGGGEYTIRLEGTGFYVDAERKYKKAVVDKDTRGLYIFTGNACGTCTVTIEDSCGQVAVGNVYSPDGQWVGSCNIYTAPTVSFQYYSSQPNPNNVALNVTWGSSCILGNHIVQPSGPGWYVKHKYSAHMARAYRWNGNYWFMSDYRYTAGDAQKSNYEEYAAFVASQGVPTGVPDANSFAPNGPGDIVFGGGTVCGSCSWDC